MRLGRTQAREDRPTKGFKSLKRYRGFSWVDWGCCGAESVGELTDDREVLLAYVDESYNKDFYFLEAAIGDEYEWSQFADALNEIRETTQAAHDLPGGFEFHAYELMSGSGEWRSFRGKHREAFGIYRAMFHAANRSGIRFVSRGLDLNGIRERRGAVIDPHGEALMHLLEQIEQYAVRKRETELVRVIADEIAIHAELQNQFRGYQEAGTWGYRSLTLDHIAMPITFASSRREAGLQLVDFAVYLRRRRQSQVEHPKAQATMASLGHELGRLTIHQHIWPARTKAPR